jgi:uncharacterized SAM-binding protein YcdF (DUF218 family)
MLSYHQTFNALLIISIALIIFANSLLKKYFPHHMLYKLFLTLICLFLVSFIAIEGLLISSISQSHEYDDCDYMIILGAGLWGDQLSPILSYRMSTALDYLESNPDTQIIVSGGKGIDEPFSEASAMSEFLISHGISEDQIFLEDRSTSTKENIKYSKEILDTLNIDSDAPIALVTSDFHILRSELIASAYDIQISGVMVDTPKSLLFNYLPREYFALIKTFIFDLR